MKPYQLAMFARDIGQYPPQDVEAAIKRFASGERMPDNPTTLDNLVYKLIIAAVDIDELSKR